MNIDPSRLWATLSPALRRQIVDDVAAVLAEVSREVRTGQANPPGAPGGCLHPTVDATPGRKQSREPAVCSTRFGIAYFSEVGGGAARRSPPRQREWR